VVHNTIVFAATKSSGDVTPGHNNALPLKK